MTSPTLVARPIPESSGQPIPQSVRRSGSAVSKFGIPLVLAIVTLCSTTAVGMRYMFNFLDKTGPYNGDADILPYAWVLSHIDLWRTGLPFSLTLLGILLAHEFGHFLACRYYKVKATLPWLLPAPSLSGTFGAVIRLRTGIPNRAALLVIGAAGPIAGFVVAIVTVAVGISLSSYGDETIMHVQPTILITAMHALIHPHSNLAYIIPHPVLSASWIGILITALNLIPAGQLDGGHLVYSVSPKVHTICTRLVVAILLFLGVFSWFGWLIWGVILLMPAMRHPRIPDSTKLTRAQFALIPVCAAIFVLSFMYKPFNGFSLIDGIRLMRLFHAHYGG
jgi:hypothetical protein